MFVLAGDIPAISLFNTSFVVLLGFLIFVGILIWKRVPQLIAGLLDKRAAGIRADLEEAKRLRDEAREIQSEYEQRLSKVQEQAAQIVETAKESAKQAGTEARAKAKDSVARRVEAGKEQIASAEASAAAQIRDRASAIALNAAQIVLAETLTGAKATSSIDDAIKDVDSALN